MFDIIEIEESERESWQEYFMKIAFIVSNRSTCLSAPKGAIIVKDKRIIATGYSGAPAGIKDCKYGYGFCNKRKLGFRSGEGHNYCLAVHAEANAILQAASLGIPVNDTIMFCTHKPCFDCFKLIINSGIKKIYYHEDYPSDMVDMISGEWLNLNNGNILEKLSIINEV